MRKSRLQSNNKLKVKAELKRSNTEKFKFNVLKDNDDLQLKINTFLYEIE